MHFLLVQILALHFLEFKFLISKLLKGKLISYLKLKQYLKTIGFEPITFSLKGRHSTDRVLFPGISASKLKIKFYINFGRIYIRENKISA